MLRRGGCSPAPLWRAILAVFASPSSDAFRASKAYLTSCVKTMAKLCYVDSGTIDMLEDSGGDAEVVVLLRRALAGRDGVELRWESTK